MYARHNSKYVTNRPNVITVQAKQVMLAMSFKRKFKMIVNVNSILSET